MVNLVFLVIVAIMLAPIAIFHSKVSETNAITIPIILFEVIYLGSAILASVWLTGTIITLVIGL